MKILLIAVNKSTFVIRDYDILKIKFNTTLCFYKDYSLKEVVNLIKEHDLIIFWFASIRFFIPTLLTKLFNKKIITITGGYDVSKVEGGSMQSIWKSIIVNFILNQSDRVIAISNSSLSELKMNCTVEQQKVSMIYHGFSPLNTIDLTKKINIVLTIGYIDDLSFSRKGIDKFIKLAHQMPNTEFHFIGTFTLKKQKVKIPANLINHGQLSLTDLKFTNLLKETKVYFQLSRHESFGCSVAEAMQYGCIPLVSNHFSLPEVAGDCGVIVSDSENINEVKKKVQYIFQNYNEDWAIKCINRINNVFNIDDRSSKILTLVDELLKTRMIS